MSSCNSMVQTIQKLAVCAVILLGNMVSMNANAQATYSDPHKVVADTTTQVIELLKTGIDPAKQPDEFIEQVSAILDPVVAFDYIAKGVMGVHAENASPEQIKQFSASFKKGLVSTYGQGISNFQDLDIVVLPSSEPIGDRRRVPVVQEIRTSSGVTKVSYSMAKNRKGQWKMLNLVLSGINFGQTFRGQFAAAVDRNGGDIDKTIQEWENGVK